MSVMRPQDEALLKHYKAVDDFSLENYLIPGKLNDKLNAVALEAFCRYHNGHLLSLEAIN